MVAADVSGSCKPWSVHMKLTHLVFADFLKQNEETNPGNKLLKVMVSHSLSSERGI